MAADICTIGFSRKSLRKFVKLMQEAGVTHLIDTRRNNTSQLAGYAKKEDLEYIMELVGIQYIHALEFAPPKQLLDDYRHSRITWEQYAEKYDAHIVGESAANKYKHLLNSDNVVLCFMCSEDKPDHCHRLLLVEHLLNTSTVPRDTKITHLY